MSDDPELSENAETISRSPPAFGSWLASISRRAWGVFAILVVEGLVGVVAQLKPVFGLLASANLGLLQLVHDIVHALLSITIFGVLLSMRSAMPWHSNHQAKAAVKQLLTLLVFVYLNWAAFYALRVFGQVSPDSQAASANTIAKFADAFLNNLQWALMFFVYSVTAQTSLRREDGRWIWVLPHHLIWPLFGVVSVSSFFFAMSLSGVEDPRWWHHGPDITSGLLNCIALSLFVGRLDSRYVAGSPWIYGLLNLYAAIQPLFFFLGQDQNFHQIESLEVLQQMLLALALMLKLLLFVFVYWAWSTGRLEVFMKAMPELDRDLEESSPVGLMQMGRVTGFATVVREEMKDDHHRAENSTVIDKRVKTSALIIAPVLWVTESERQILEELCKAIRSRIGASLPQFDATLAYGGSIVDVHQTIDPAPVFQKALDEIDKADLVVILQPRKMKVELAYSLAKKKRVFLVARMRNELPGVTKYFDRAAINWISIPEGVTDAAKVVVSELRKKVVGA